MEIQSLRIESPPDTQIIVAQSHFIKTVEDVSECLVNCVPNIRHSGNDGNLDLLATDYAFRISSGHSLIILIKEAFPINILPRLREVSEIVNIYCATANPIEIIFVETEQGRAILGIVDGFKSKGIESEKEIEERKWFLRKIGYKM
jgi:uncharacterized protein